MLRALSGSETGARELSYEFWRREKRPIIEGERRGAYSRTSLTTFHIDQEPKSISWPLEGRTSEIPPPPIEHIVPCSFIDSSFHHARVAIYIQMCFCTCPLQDSSLMDRAGCTLLSSKPPCILSESMPSVRYQKTGWTPVAPQ